jgi:hypothetical protein
MNLNLRPTGVVRLQSTGKTEWFFNQTLSDKKAALKKYAMDGISNDADAICAECWPIVRPCAKKASDNPHYGCVQKCCSFLHRWTVCESCIDHHLNPLKVDNPARMREAEKFRRVFSRLPDDVQRHILEYVPAVFEFVRLVARIPRDRLLDSYTNLPKSAWQTALNCMRNHYMASGLGSNPSRKAICEEIKRMRATVSSADETYIIRDYDYVQSMTWKCLRFSTRKVLVLNQIKDCLYSAKKNE